LALKEREREQTFADNANANQGRKARTIRRWMSTGSSSMIANLHMAFTGRFIFTAFVCGFTLHAADQPQWCSAWTRNMVSDEKGLPDSFDPETGRNILWIAPLGTHSHSTPIV